MRQIGLTRKQVQRLKNEGCVCQWYLGDGWERDFDPFDDSCMADHRVHRPYAYSEGDASALDWIGAGFLLASLIYGVGLLIGMAA